MPSRGAFLLAHVEEVDTIVWNIVHGRARLIGATWKPVNGNGSKTSHRYGGLVDQVQVFDRLQRTVKAMDVLSI